LGTTQAFGAEVGVLKVAVTVSAALIVNVQLLVPEQPAPDQPANVEPEAAAAVKVTLVPLE
jgi:hypothetical protein